MLFSAGWFIPSESDWDVYTTSRKDAFQNGSIYIALGFENSLSDYLALRVEGEGLPGADILGKRSSGGLVRIGTTDIGTLGLRAGLTWYPFHKTTESQSFFLGAGAAYRYAKVLVYQEGRDGYARHDTTSDSAIGPYFLAGFRIKWFFSEVNYDILSLSKAGMPESIGGLTLKAGCIFTI